MCVYMCVCVCWQTLLWSFLEFHKDILIHYDYTAVKSYTLITAMLWNKKWTTLCIMAYLSFSHACLVNEGEGFEATVSLLQCHWFSYIVITIIIIIKGGHNAYITEWYTFFPYLCQFKYLPYVQFILTVIESVSYWMNEIATIYIQPSLKYNGFCCSVSFYQPVCYVFVSKDRAKAHCVLNRVFFYAAWLYAVDLCPSETPYAAKSLCIL